MNSKQMRELQRGRRVGGFLAAHPEVVGDPTTPGLAEHHAALRAVVNELGVAAAGQEAHFLAAKGATAEVRNLRDLLMGQNMRAVATVAQHAIPDVVKMTVALQMPNQEIGIERVLVSADAMFGAATQSQDALIKAGLPADGLARLRSVTEQLRSAIDARGQSIGNRRGATEKVDVLIVQARRHITTIDALLARVLNGNRALLAEWKQVKRVTIKGVPHPASAEVPATPVTPVTPIDPVVPAAAAQDKAA